MTNDSTFLTRVVLSNYKSIRQCDVSLQPLTFLVGPNGSGKSNFLEALRFVAESLRTSVEHAIRERGGINEVRRRSSGHPNHFGIRLFFRLDDGRTGHYAFRIGALKGGGFEVQQEECRIGEAHFLVRSGVVVESSFQAPPATSDRLYLVNASAFTEFRSLYDSLSRMGFYNLNPERIRDLQPPDSGQLLSRDGSNLTSVIRQMTIHLPAEKLRIEQYLAKIVPGIEGVEAKIIGPRETLEFRQQISGAKFPWHFLAANMSDGTLRALGVLVALLQNAGNGAPRKPALVGLEEPETALHPGAAGVLLDSLRDASQSTQIIVTSHSPDLLDNNAISVESLLSVHSAAGETTVTQVDQASRQAIKSNLYTAGELLRIGQLAPDQAEVDNLQRSQLRLFDSVTS